MIRFLLILLPCVFLCLNAPAMAAGRARYFLVVVWDGMRPDFVRPDLTPALCRLKDGGVWFAKHHSAYPTSTEVNGAVLATGGFPQRTGICANKEYRREINPLTRYPTQSLQAVKRGDELTGWHYVGLPTVAERVQEAGGRTAVAGAKPVALLHDRRPRDAGARGRVWFVDGAWPEGDFDRLTARFGPFPPAASPNTGRDTWATRCLTQDFWSGELPRYSLLWLSEPDNSQHEHGPGSVQALESIRQCDARLEAVLSELEGRGLRSETDIVVVSDHGFSTIGANADVGAALRAAGVNARADWEKPPVDGDVVVVGNGGSVMLYVVGRNREVRDRVVRSLRRQTFTGVIFTKDRMEGTFPLEEARMAAATAPDIVVSTRWRTSGEKDGHTVNLVFNDGYNEYEAGCGMHVTLCPTDLHNMAVASGPDFRTGFVDSFPSGNVDVAPTLLWLMGLSVPEKLDGRVLKEALAAERGASTGRPEPARIEARVADSDEGRTWLQYLSYTEFDGVRYLEEGNGGPVDAIAEAGLPAGRESDPR